MVQNHAETEQGAYLEEEQQSPGLRALTPLRPQLQPLIGLLNSHELVPPLGVLVRMVLPGKLPAIVHGQLKLLFAHPLVASHSFIGMQRGQVL